jgi:hypothetical protein
MKKLRCVIFALFLIGVPGVQGNNNGPPSLNFKLGILYINSPTGKRFKDGIVAAIKKYNDLNGKRFNDAREFSYDNETDGLDELVKIISGEKGEEERVDILFGPTESGVYIRAIEQRKDLEAHKIPVISSQVASKIPHQVGGWFFRTNINVQRRAQVIYDYLNKYWVQSIAVIYEDTEFGRRAEEAFANELQGRQKELYLSLSYNSSAKARSQIRQILARRPEAVGIISSRRSDFVRIVNWLKTLNAGLSNYFPMTFSVIDIRTIQKELFQDKQENSSRGNSPDNNSVYFVSVTEGSVTEVPGNQMRETDVTQKVVYDDVRAIAYDTTMIILRELDTLSRVNGFVYNDKNDSWRDAFRSRFESILNGNIEIGRGDIKIESKTGISFRNFENETTPKVFELNKSDPDNPIEMEETIGFFKKIGHKLESMRNRFGDWPIIINLIIIFVVVLLTSIRDIKRLWWTKSHRYLQTFHFWLLPLVNYSIALATYIYLGETGSIRYDSILAALVLSLTPSAVLHLTLFETPGGKSIGLARYYDGFLQWIYGKMSVENYLKNKFYVNVIAYHNSVYAMKSLFKEIYGDVLNKEQAIRLQTRIEEDLKNADSWIGRRKAMAHLVLRKFNWDELVDLNIIAEEFRGRGPGSKDHLIPYDDPENVMTKTARACARDEDKIKEIDKQIELALIALGKETEERKEELVADYEKDKSEMKTHAAIMKKRIIFFSLLNGYKRDVLEKMGLEKKPLDILKEAVAHWAGNENKQEILNNANAAVEELLPEKVDDKKDKFSIVFKILFILGIIFMGIISIWGTLPIWGTIFILGIMIFTWGMVLRWGTKKIKDFKEEKRILRKILVDEKIDEASFERKIRYLLLRDKDEIYFKDRGLLPENYQYIEPPEEGTNGEKEDR